MDTILSGNSISKILSKDVLSCIEDSYRFAIERKHKIVSLEHYLYHILEDDAIDQFFQSCFELKAVDLQNMIFAELHQIDNTADGDVIPQNAEILDLFFISMIGGYRNLEKVYTYNKSSGEKVVFDKKINMFGFLSFILYFLVDMKEENVDLKIYQIMDDFFEGVFDNQDEFKNINTLGDVQSIFFNEFFSFSKKEKNASFKNSESNDYRLSQQEIKKAMDDAVLSNATTRLELKNVNGDSGLGKSEFLESLNQMVLNDKVDSCVYGFEEKYDEVISVLSRRDKATPIIVGSSGVGKTALVYGLVNSIISGKSSPKMVGKEFYHLDLNKLMAGTKYRGELEERIAMVIDFIKSSPKNILFIDNIQSSSREFQNILDVIKVAVSESKIKLIMTSTFDEYYKLSKKDPSIERRFEKVYIEEPNKDLVIDIVKSKINVYEKYHNVSFSDEIIGLIVDLSSRYIHKQAFPDKAFDVIDYIGSKYSSKGNGCGFVVKDVDVFEAVGKKAKINLSRSGNELDKIVNLEKKLKDKIFGQDEAINEICSALFLSAADLNDKNKPYATMLFTGSTGVGKTELVKQLSESLNRPLHRFDMSEFSEKHTVSKIIGSPSGYVGYEEGGLLTKAVLEDPYSIILLDEIEKAHQDIYNVFLQVFDYGFLTDSRGEKVSFRNTIIIMTSNAGVAERKGGIVGFGNKSEKLDDSVLKNYFKPEFLNRLSSVVDFKPLTSDIIMNIVEKNINEFKDKLVDRNVSVNFTPAVKKYLADNGFNDEMGARPIERIVRKEIAEPISREIIFSEYKKKKIKEIKVSISEQKIIFDYK